MMQYASEDMLRDYLEDSDAVPSRVFGSLLTRATSLLNERLRFAFGGDVEIRYLDVGFVTRLRLPIPGASTVLTVLEDGIELESDEYELDPERGLFLTRLDSDTVIRWTPGPRAVRVTYAPALPPPALQQACLELAVELWRGKTAGYADTIGVAGSNEQRYSGAFSAATRSLLRDLRRTYGIDRP